MPYYELALGVCNWPDKEKLITVSGVDERDAFLNSFTTQEYREIANFADLNHERVCWVARLLQQLEYERPSFDEIIEKLKNGGLSLDDIPNFCINRGKNSCTAYLMGEGSEQLMASKKFNSEAEIRELYRSLGVKRILPI